MTFASVSLIQRLMKLIDSHLVPEPFRSAIFDDKYEKGIDVVASATTIIKPVRVTKLRKEYFADMQESAVRRVSALLGTAVHNILEEYGEGLGWHVERRLYGVSKSGLSYSGQLDALIPNGDETWTIGDYKVVPTFKHNQLDEYFDQLNIQAALARQAGYDVTGLKVVAIFKDWMESRSKRRTTTRPHHRGIRRSDAGRRELDDWIDSRLRQIVGDELPECSQRSAGCATISGQSVNQKRNVPPKCSTIRPRPSRSLRWLSRARVMWTIVQPRLFAAPTTIVASLSGALSGRRRSTYGIYRVCARL